MAHPFLLNILMATNKHQKLKDKFAAKVAAQLLKEKSDVLMLSKIQKKILGDYVLSPPVLESDILSDVLNYFHAVDDPRLDNNLAYLAKRLVRHMQINLANYSGRDISYFDTAAVRDVLEDQIRLEFTATKNYQRSDLWRILHRPLYSGSSNSGPSQVQSTRECIPLGV